MNRAMVLLPMLLLLFAPSAFGQVPEHNAKAVCKARSADAKMVKSPPDQSIADCVRDEEAAKQQLDKLWASTPVSIRNRCESDTRFLGMRSYLDVLSCIYIADDSKAGPKKDAEKK
jgi:hypothetical protein